MTDQSSKYEVASKEYAGRFQNNDFVRSIAKSSFLAGASFAEKEAHNAAIDKALTTMKIEWREDRHKIYNAIEKLKI